MPHRNPGRKNTLRFQAYITIGLTLISIATIYTLILFSFEKERRKTVVKKIELSIRAIVEQRQELIANELYLNHQEAVRFIINRMLMIESMAGIVVFRKDGSVFAASGKTPLRNLTQTERKQSLNTYCFIIEDWKDQPVAIYSQPILVIGETLGYVKVYYALTDVVRESRWAILIFSMLLLTILLAMTMMLHTFLTRSVIRPVGLIIDAMRKVKDGNLGHQVVLNACNEIEEMAHTFNQMSIEKARIYQELTDLNKHLEQKIAGSTKALKKERITLKATLERLRNTQEELLAQSDQLEIARREAELSKRNAEAASQAKSEFISHMNHELRTPLNGIMGYAQILSRDRSLTQTQSEGIHVINQASRHLLTLINDILNLSKIEARKLKLSPTEFPFKVFLEEIAAIIRMKASQKNVAFSYEVKHEALPRCVCTDKKYLRQVLLNLLGNAVRYTQLGQVVFRVYPISPAVASEQQKGKKQGIGPTPEKGDRKTVSQASNITVRFEIDDTGPGIAPEWLEKIFLPFEQVEQKKTHTTGTGLGLTISHRLIALMQSKIYVKSEIGRGSRFWFDLSLNVIESGSENVKRDVSAIAGYMGKERTLLIIDDNTSTLLMMGNLLEPIGFKCLRAQSGKEAISMLQHRHPDAILVDLMMPGMTGFDTIREIRKIPELEHVAIIAISASTFKQYQQKSMQVGSNAFLPKPVNVNMLFQLLATHLQIQWIYDEADVDNINLGAPDHFDTKYHDLIPPPRQEMEVLLEMAEIGDMRSIQDRARSMEKLDSCYRPFAQRLYHLSRNCRDKQILTLVEHYMDTAL